MAVGKLSIALHVGAVSLAAASACWAGDFADTVHDFTPGSADAASGVIDTTQCRGAPQALDVSDALGPPDGRYVSIGEQGTITLALSERIVVDGPGDDLRVWGSCNAPNEPGQVLASADGESYVTLGAFDQGVARSFDLASVGLAWIRFVRIVDLEGGTGLPIGLAFDVDAVEGLHVDGVVASRLGTWGRIKAEWR